MTHLTRRGFTLAGAASLAAPAIVRAQAGAGRLLIVGGGFGGASAARHARDRYPNLEVTLLEPAQRFTTSPYGNLILAGRRSRLEQISHGYAGLAARGVRLVHAAAQELDFTARIVRTSSGETLGYDKLILAPGIDLRFGVIEGYDQAASQIMPHGWKPSLQPVTLLRDQLVAMPDGGTFIMTAPPNPFRCPPGPYERASMVAEYFKRHKPRAKILILDAKEGFSKQPLFLAAWRELYGDMIEWVPANKEGRVVRVDPRAMEVETEFGQRHKGDVINIIPPQYAAAIIRSSGLAAETGWAPIKPKSFESARAEHVFIIGDANNGTPMPKSGFVAMTTAQHAVTCAAHQLTGQPLPASPVYFNTCYSHVGEDYGISIVGVFRPAEDNSRITEVPNSGGITPPQPDTTQRARESGNADGWYQAITRYAWPSA